MVSWLGANAAWRVAVKPFRDFEDAVSYLAASNLHADHNRYADCLMNVLMDWARANGLAKFGYTKKTKQGWFQVIRLDSSHGEYHAVFLPDRPLINPAIAQHFGPPPFDKLQIVGIINDARQIGVFIVNAQGEFMGHCATLPDVVAAVQNNPSTNHRKSFAHVKGPNHNPCEPELGVS